MTPKPDRAPDSNSGSPNGLSTSISTIDSFGGDHDDANGSTTDEEDWEHVGAAGLRALRDVRLLPNASREITTGSSIKWKAILFEGHFGQERYDFGRSGFSFESNHLNSDTFRALGGTDTLDTVLAPSSSIWLPSIIEGESAKSDPAPNSNSGSIASLLQWEQDRDIELIHHMQRVEKRLDDRADKLGRKEAFLGCPGLEFLDDLRFAFGEWLTEVEAEAKASEEDLAEFDAQWQKLHLAQSRFKNRRDHKATG